MNRIGDVFGSPWTAGIGLPGPNNNMFGQHMVDRMIREIVKAVIAQTMAQGAAGAAGQTGLGGLPIQDNPFAAAGSPCGGASLFQGAPELPAAGMGTLPNILGPAPDAGASPCGCSSGVGSMFNDPRAMLTGFDAGQLLAQRLMAALPGQAAAIAQQAGAAPGIPGLGVGAGAPAVDPQLLANGTANAGAPQIFNALNVHQDLRNWAGACGAKGCCKWEPAIA